jgi:hypothetical protein
MTLAIMYGFPFSRIKAKDDDVSELGFTCQCFLLMVTTTEEP